ncbi:MAG: hypothetical protein DRJ34_02840 [Thermoprotei archaeon]|nr:MAG: hypothetical protein DRJ34_02840 [Thermoprotei archaeon]
MRKNEVLFIFTSIILTVLLIYDYSEYFFQVESIKKLDVILNSIKLYRFNESIFVNASIDIGGNGVKTIKILMITYKIFFDNDLVREYTENFALKGFKVQPGQIFVRKISLKIPYFKYSKHLYNASIKGVLVVDIYVDTFFGKALSSYRFNFIVTKPNI